MEGELPQLRWSATYAVADPANVKSIPGDKILLPQSALEEQLSAATAASSSSRTQPTHISRSRNNPYFASSRSDAINPESDPNADSWTPQLPSRKGGPLTFRLVNPANGNTVHAGIQEFSAEEGDVALSPYLLDALGIDPKELSAAQDGASPEDAVDLTDDADAEPKPKPTTRPQITVHAKLLPKGTYVRLRPLEAGYDPGDWKSLLERQLRESYTTLTKGALLSVKGVKGEMFRFLIDKFMPEGDGICVVDTDLEVDIEALNEEQARETVRQIMAKSQKAPGTAAGSSIGHEINIWKAVEGQVVPGEYVDYELPSWDRSQPLQIELSGLQDDDDAVNLLVSPKSARQRAHPRDTEHVFGVFATTNGSKTLLLQPTNAELDGAEELLISVHGYSGSHSDSDAANSTPHFTLRVQSMAAESNAGKDDATDQAGEQAGGADEEQCSNCHQWVPKRTMVLHESFCRRNNIACPQCSGVFKKDSSEWQHHWHCPHDDSHGSSEASKAKHDDIFHTDRQCPNCPFQTNSIPDLARHRTSVCPGKIILCQFCHLEVPQEGDPFNPSAETLLSGLSAHEVADGARTADCHLCGKIVRLRDMTTHLKHHELDKAQRTKPPICRNPNCGRTLNGVGRGGAVSGTQMGQGPGNDLGLCSLCFSPLYVQLHDPEGKALRRRIERRYLSQLLQGCGKKWCANEWCKTGRANLGLEPKGSNTQTILPQIKPLLVAVPNAAEPMFFCVDETNHKRRNLAEMLAAENVWELEWCVAACEAEGVDPDKAREWLRNWAPTRS
ncbi:ubiquitin fusion degradation protein (Ufd1) [Apiospora rasikravindrae]|uniref:Ubiquitin fusion degradation protein (Ufd1) n=1 Tax=Apiospora rasikravindrae TaxID=990691 RepID=A0ABR1SEP0_9PEZI